MVEQKKKEVLVGTLRNMSKSSAYLPIWSHGGVDVQRCVFSTWNTVTMAHSSESKFFRSGTVSPVSVFRLNLQPKMCIPKMLQHTSRAPTCCDQPIHKWGFDLA